MTDAPTMRATSPCSAGKADGLNNVWKGKLASARAHARRYFDSADAEEEYVGGYRQGQAELVAALLLKLQDALIWKAATPEMMREWVCNARGALSVAMGEQG